MERLVYYLLSIPPILFALTVHEYCHGYVAWRMGDPTARFAGRLTFNPIKHIDPLGLLAFIIFRFGWAKPVPVNENNFYDIKQGVIYTSLAGPLSNFLSAMVIGLAARFVPITPIIVLFFLKRMLELAVVYNLIFCIFNLIPIPPLDGSHVLFHLLPAQYSYVEHWMTRYGFYLLMGLILLDRLSGGLILWAWIGQFVRFFGTLFAGGLTVI